MRTVIKTSDDYSKAVMAEYHRSKTTLHEGLLISPSPAGLRDLCLKMIANGISAQDENVFRTFFKLNSTEDVLRGIKKFDLEKFRPVINFLIGKSRATDARNLNFIAVLIQFKERPLSRFIGSDRDSGTIPDGGKPEDVVFRPRQKSQFTRRNSVWVGVLSVALVGLIAYLTFARNPSEKQCMGWNDHAYETLDCRTSKGLSVRPLDSLQFRVREIDAKADTEFFIQGRPVVWYLRHDGKYEFFDHPGHHPVKIDKQLIPVSTYIARQVVSGEIKADY
ncbi:hypothetical protein [Flavobacterium selenitireducens]|uniref:hypothetical protein n=1 Tax=Flavobacterium selenitireducens TaxID=2722704 RepID=UPI00168AE3D6|nr:hypothetical protein [Flavobacterium selenitireducens]MBD3581731.1 hypothetical protein [Flavobacterium selenitireducens]